MRKMLKLLKDRIAEYVHLCIMARYNYIEEKDAKNRHEDAAFLFFLDVVNILLYSVFTLFAVMSFFFLLKEEVIPVLRASL